MSYQVGVLALYLAGRRLEELAFFRKLCVSGQKLGVEVLVFTPDDVDESKRQIHAITYNTASDKWTRKKVGFPPIIYDRCRYHGADNYRKISHFRRTFTKLNYVSRPLANKWRMHQILSESEKIVPHLPSTTRYKDSKELLKICKRYSTVYLKPQGGTGGRGILRLQRLQGGEAFLLQGRDPSRQIIPAHRVEATQLATRLSSLKLNDRYIVQQGIQLELKDGRVHDFRMLVQKDGTGQWQITGCAGRIGPRKSVTSNLHGGGTASPMDSLLKSRFGSSEKVAEIKETAYALGLNVVEHLDTKFDTFCEVGIDLAVDPKGHVWLLEVNPKPSREVFYRIGEKETYRKAIRRPLEFSLWLLKQRKQADKGAAAAATASVRPTFLK
ncbi:YheC/YheD family endospore coat-associated protein [Paenibacillus cremeus]|uniref:YheC/YheD family protein n=1 Tax=Paenibacillus cremeus TaxID=2163881 RepID=A0A559K5J1_9BACL|nr:YheC/YheD family protein [Paenibacillus cremeus]TVY07411.1 YheC/YheD family protein [Paenibacillus cremeus]